MSPAKRLQALKQEDFERLLLWLDPDPDRAGEIYERIRWRLIAILAARACRIPEDLADETIDRVAGRVADIRDSYVGDKGIYFLGVMNNVNTLSGQRCIRLSNLMKMWRRKSGSTFVWIDVWTSWHRIHGA